MWGGWGMKSTSWRYLLVAPAVCADWYRIQSWVSLNQVPFAVHTCILDNHKPWLKKSDSAWMPDVFMDLFLKNTSILLWWKNPQESPQMFWSDVCTGVNLTGKRRQSWCTCGVGPSVAEGTFSVVMTVCDGWWCETSRHYSTLTIFPNKLRK